MSLLERALETEIPKLRPASPRGFGQYAEPSREVTDIL